MIKSMRRIWAIFKKEFVQLKRDKTTLGMMIFIPIMQLFLFGYAINSDPKNLPTAVLSQDHSIFSRNILTSLCNSQYFKVTHSVKNEQEGKSLLQKGLVTFFVTIPESFHRDLIRGNRPSVLVEADGADPVAIAGALGAVDEIVRLGCERDAKGALHFLKKDQPPYNLRLHKMYNPEGLSRYNIIPGLIAIVLMFTCVNMTALSLTREKEQGTMENLLSMPVKPFEVMFGKIIPYIVIGYIQACIIIVSAYFLFNLPILGSLPLLILGLFIFIACKLSLGFTVSAASQNQGQALQMSMFFVLPSILLSGFMFPFQGMPAWAQALGSIVPSTYFIRIVRGIMLKGCTLTEIWPHIWPLLVLMSMIMAFAMKVYKKTLD